MNQLTRQEAYQKLCDLGHQYYPGNQSVMINPVINRRTTREDIKARCYWMQRAVDVRLTWPDIAEHLRRAALTTGYLWPEDREWLESCPVPSHCTECGGEVVLDDYETETYACSRCWKTY